jgi:hypothetical protein
LFTPSQLSATSQSPAEARHTAVLFASGGQLSVDPSQFSATSHTPADARQVNVFGSFASAGHSLLVPSQFSATSQSPAAGRHTVVFGSTTSTGQVGPVPVQNSEISHTSPAEAARHTVVAGWKLSAGQFALVPSQLSATSQSPADGRQTPELANPSAGQLPPLQVSATSQGPADGRHRLPSGSGAVQFPADSLHDSEQLVSPFGPGHGSPVWVLQLPPAHESVPLQKILSLQLVPSGLLVKF